MRRILLYVDISLILVGLALIITGLIKGYAYGIFAGIVVFLISFSGAYKAYRDNKKAVNKKEV